MSFPLASRIGLLHVVGAVDTPALRGRLGGLLEGLEPPPGRLPPSAVLLVRELEDPAPGTLGARASASDADWRAALHRRLEQCARRAVRPRRGLVPSDADVVLFEDESELRACLALALIRGRQYAWWCKIPLQHYGPMATRIAALLGAEPRHLPETWSQLVGWLEPEELVRAVREPEARQLIPLMLAERGLSRLIAGLRLEQAAQLVMPDASLAPALSFWRELFPRPARIFARPIFWAAQAPALLLLSGLAEALQHQHFRLRQPSFATDLAAWWRALVQPPEALPGRLATSTPQTREGERRRDREALIQFVPRPAAADSPDAGQASAPVVAITGHQGSPERTTPRAVDPARQPAASLVNPLPDATNRDEPALQAGAPAAAPASTGPESSVEEGALPAETSADAEAYTESPEDAAILYPGCETETSWGGLFFLINAMTSLGLPDGLDQHPLWGLGPWAQLELLGRGLLEQLAGEVVHDPIWRLLAQLDDRAVDVPLGHEQAPLPEQPLPGAWTNTLGAAAPALEPLVGPPGSLLVELPHAWIVVGRRVAAFLRRRLVCSGIASSELERVFRKRARIYLSRSHLDVVLALDDVSLPARIAGLDKNPGWVPSFGHVIGFHYQ